MPGIAPSTTSSSPGWPAAVTDTESPSQLIPSEIHRMLTSCTLGGLTGSVAIRRSPVHRRELVVKLQGIHEQLLAAEQLDVRAAAARAQQREGGQLRRRPAAPAA